MTLKRTLGVLGLTAAMSLIAYDVNVRRQDLISAQNGMARSHGDAVGSYKHTEAENPSEAIDKIAFDMFVSFVDSKNNLKLETKTPLTDLSKVFLTSNGSCVYTITQQDREIYVTVQTPKNNTFDLAKESSKSPQGKSDLQECLRLYKN